MNTDTSWQAFAQTGNILRYLDYKQQRPEQTITSAGDKTDGYDRNTGARPEGDTVQGI